MFFQTPFLYGRESEACGMQVRDRKCAAGCDSLHLSVDEAGAFNVRTLGQCVLPYAMYRDGFAGDVNFTGVRGSIYVNISPMLEQFPEPSAPPPSVSEELAAKEQCSGVPVSLAPSLYEEQPSGVPASVAPSLCAEQQPSGVPATAALSSVEEPWVAMMMVPRNPSPFVDSAAASVEDPVAARGSFVPASATLAVASVEPTTAKTAMQVVRGSGVPASDMESRVAALLPINLTVCTYNVAQILAELPAQHKAQGHNFIPCLHRGVDPMRDLTWLAFGFDLATKSFPVDDIMDFPGHVGPERMDLATKLKTSLLTISQAGMSPQMNVVLTCFQDRQLD